MLKTIQTRVTPSSKLISTKKSISYSVRIQNYSFNFQNEFFNIQKNFQENLTFVLPLLQKTIETF